MTSLKEIVLDGNVSYISRTRLRSPKNLYAGFQVRYTASPEDRFTLFAQPNPDFCGLGLPAVLQIALHTTEGDAHVKVRNIRSPLNPFLYRRN